MRILKISFLLLLLFFFACKSGKQNQLNPADLVIKEARSYVGVPYRYGGTSRGGMDCSGLLLRSFEAIDYPMPRTTKLQRKIGKKTSLRKIKKGDIVFFAAGKSKRKITHVGLITEVRGKDNIRFIHASTKLGVVESNLMSKYYQKIFIQARSIL